MITGHRQHGMSLLELLVAAAIATVVIGAALPLLARMQAASVRGMPEARRVMTRDTVRAEFARASDSSAKIAYFDLQATVAGIRSQIGGSQGPTPPPGYCLVEVSDSTTWPPGFDPRDRTTWTRIAWWQGADPNDPSTWYWDCGGSGARATGTGTGGGLPTTPIDLDLQPAVRFGSGIRVGQALRIVGPLAVSPESSPAVSGQVGDAVTFLFTDSTFLSFTLGATFQGNSGVIRLVARDSIDVNQISDLVAGDILVVNGRTTAGEYATALASLTGPFQQVAISSFADSNRNVFFKYYEAPIERPSGRYAFGLHNSDLASAGVDIVDDASIALLDRAAPVVTYYTSRDGNLYTLHRLVGDPANPAEDELAVSAASAPLTVTVDWAGSSGLPEDMRGVTLVVPLAAPEIDNRAAGPIEVHLNLSGAIGREPVTLHYRYLGETTSGGGGGR